MSGTFDIDIDVSFCVDAPAEKEVESKDCQQDNNDNGYGRHTATGVFRHIPPLLNIDGKENVNVR